MTIYRACEIILLPEDFASAVFLPSLSKNANTKGRKMKPEMISTKFKYFFDWYGQYIVFTTKKQCKEYLKTKPNINRIKDLKEIGIEEWHKISKHPRDQVFEIIDGIAIPMEIEIDESNEEAALGYPNCPNCADQASIAAPGQTTLCKTHSDEKHYADMKEFFDENIQEIFFYIHLPFCSRCGKNNPEYILLIQHEKHNPSNFAVCVNCRDELRLKQNAARAAQERIGA